MRPIDPARLQQDLETFAGKDVFVHLETTHGAYTRGGFGAFARNVRVRFHRAGVSGQGPYRVGLRLEHGWIYAEGLTHWEIDRENRLLIAGHDEEGRLTVTLEISRQPFPLATSPPGAAGAGGTAGTGTPGAADAGTSTATGARIPATPPGDGPATRAGTPVDGAAAGTPVPAPDERHLLVVLAHPDDESFACAGVMALAARRGVPVTCVCATRGQMGRRVGNPPTATRESLPALRERELREALATLGVRDVRLLDLWDKTVEFEDPDRLSDRITAILDETRPSTVITFHPEYGGHPDHNAIGAATIRAVLRLAPALRPRVLCPAVPVEQRDPGLPLQVAPIGEVRGLKAAALRAHRSQTEGWEERMARDPELRRLFERIFAEERFWVYPVV